MPAPILPVVIAPTYNNGRMLRDVLAEIDIQGFPVIVINDGSNDETPSILQQWSAGGEKDDREVLVHPLNRGKAAALRTGFARAAERGFTHAVTIDTDAQLDPKQIGVLIEAAIQHPTAMIVGDRDCNAADYPAGSRVGRWISNAMVRLESGAQISDTQCGFRVYPLNLVLALPTRASRYGFETEVLTWSAWVGASIVQVPVHCTYNVAGGRISHLHPVKDALRHAAMHARLLGRSLLPIPVRRVDSPDHPRDTGTIARRLMQWFSPARAWRQVRDTPDGRSQFAAALALGVFIANLPLYGVQTLLSIYAAKRFRLHPLPAVVGSHLSTPPVGPLLIAAAIAVGHAVLTGHFPELKSFDPAALGYVGLLRAVLVEWMIGSVIVGGVLAVIIYGATRVCLRFARATSDEG